MRTKTKIAICRAKIEKLRNEIFKLQSECKHGNVKKTHWSNDNDGFPTLYYTDFECQECGKYWTEDGSL